MADLRRSSYEDPLLAYSGLSLFTRTLKSLSLPLPPPLYQSEDLHQTHTLLDSLPFYIQKEHQEQARATLDDSSKQGTGTSVESEDVIAGVKMNPIQNKRERRPGLDRKRGQFSFKPMTSQPASNEPTFDGSKYPKPDEYFAAHERFKNAKREWDKLNGISVADAHQNQPSRRPRRPGIPGRKRSSYTHTFTDSYFTDDISLETSEKENPIPSEQSLERTTAANSTADKEVDDVSIETDKNLENILSELLACDKDELKGDGAVKLLEERLQIKSIDLEKLTIPEFQDVREMRLKASGRNPSKRKSVLSDIQNMLQGTVRKNRQASSPNPPVDQFSFPDSDYLPPVDQQPGMADPAKDLNVCSRSPVTKDTVKDRTITSPPNLGTVYIASPFNSSVQKSSNEDNADTHSGNHSSHSTPDGNTDNCVDDIIINRNSATLEVNVDMQTKGNKADVPVSESEANRDTGRRESEANSATLKLNADMQTKGNETDVPMSESEANRDTGRRESEANSATLKLNADMQTKGNEADVAMSESVANRDTGRRENDADINEETDQLDSLAKYASREAARMDPFTVEEDSIPYQQDESSKTPKRTPEQCNSIKGSYEHVENIQEQDQEVNDNMDTGSGLQEENTQEELHYSSHEQTKKRTRGSCDSNKKKRSKTVLSENEGDQQMKTSSHESVAKKQTKRKSNEKEEKKKQMKRVTREGKIFSRRKSLAAAGTNWETGVRRSTRIKSRPLEFWRGERFLIGRIHESLATVIGIKYASPDKYASKVKSFVSDDYKEMVDMAALH